MFWRHEVINHLNTTVKILHLRSTRKRERGRERDGCYLCSTERRRNGCGTTCATPHLALRQKSAQIGRLTQGKIHGKKSERNTNTKGQKEKSQIKAGERGIATENKLIDTLQGNEGGQTERCQTGRWTGQK